MKKEGCRQEGSSPFAPQSEVTRLTRG